MLSLGSDPHRFRLPEAIQPLVQARNALRDHYGHASLPFTFDGNLVGDLGEAIAVELFGLELGRPCGPGVDGLISGKTVHVKATGTGRGPAFRKVETEAEHLLFFHLDFHRCEGTIEFNGPESIIRSLLPATWTGQRQITLAAVRRANLSVPQTARLPLVAAIREPTVRSADVPDPGAADVFSSRTSS